MENTPQARILVVDGAGRYLAQVNDWLQPHYDILLVNSGHAALRLLREEGADLVLLAAGPVAAEAGDARPGSAGREAVNGHALAREILANPLTGKIPLIFLCERSDPEHEQRAFDAGASDVVAWPLCGKTLLARLAVHLQLSHAHDRLDEQHKHLDELVAERTRELEHMLDATILAMASLAETRDNLTVNHLRRTQHYVAALARALRDHPRFAGQLGDDNIALLFKAAPLHDVGKVGVPDAILLKPGRLSDEEYAIMKRHTVYGRDALLDVERHLGSSNAFLRHAREIAYSHQEKFDGSGYPEGLAGDAIPVSARLMAVADFYDALISKRVYKPAFTHETAIELIRQGRGEHFDPDMVDAMLMIEEELMAIAARYPDA